MEGSNTKNELADLKRWIIDIQLRYKQKNNKKLIAIDKRRQEVEKEAEKSYNARAAFLEGKAEGLKEAYRIVKIIS